LQAAELRRKEEAERERKRREGAEEALATVLSARDNHNYR
jgi:hypothetical protein